MKNITSEKNTVQREDFSVDAHKDLAWDLFRLHGIDILGLGIDSLPEVSYRG